MKQFIAFFATLALILCVLQTATAQIGNGRFQIYTLDTLTNADTIIWEFDRPVWDLNTYERSYQIAFTKISGTTACNCIIQETMYQSGTDWINVDTIAFGNASSTVFDTGNLTGVKLRLNCISSGTMSASIKGILRIRRKLGAVQ
jgi:hypothetical protein